MSKRRFNAQQIAEILSNVNVSQCSPKSITYSHSFKERAVQQYYEEGLSPSQIFVEAGFNLHLIGKDIPIQRLRAWRRVMRTKGIHELTTETRGRGKGGGRPKTKGITEADRIKRLELEVAYLKAENGFLAKLRAGKTE